MPITFVFRPFSCRLAEGQTTLEVTGDTVGEAVSGVATTASLGWPLRLKDAKGARIHSWRSI